MARQRQQLKTLQEQLRSRRQSLAARRSMCCNSRARWTTPWPPGTNLVAGAFSETDLPALIKRVLSCELLARHLRGQGWMSWHTTTAATG
ncbi:MAG: hypothetical protein LBV05_16620 [Comamonas sp.]|jgi:hypothetical protein|uniref:hypothetical protein n=1 Tax=Comamonas sp. TaxID=34028 RepID=UPI0025C5DFCC|nr:hypothetical protein [Comamonas sp.]MDR3067111.1 hypothetical protein [Comamonas sp.]